MKLLITGAAGFIGRHLTAQLIDSDYEIILLDRFTDSFSDQSHNELLSNKALPTTLTADLSNLNQTLKAVEEARPDAVIHLASSGVSQANLPVEQAISDNVFGALNLIKACYEGPESVHPEKFILARTPGELTAMNVYAASKAAAWNFCSMFARTRSYPILGAMIYQAYGPYQPETLVIPSAFDAAFGGQDFPMTSGEQMKDWIYVDDVVKGIRWLLSSSLDPGTTIELGTGKATSLISVVERIFELVGGPGKPLPGALKTREGEATVQVANVNENSEQILWSPKVFLEDGLMKYYNWLLEQP